MSIEQKKISLINWITTLEDEAILDQMAVFQNSSLEELPGAIVQQFVNLRPDSIPALFGFLSASG